LSDFERDNRQSEFERERDRTIRRRGRRGEAHTNTTVHQENALVDEEVHLLILGATGSGALAVAEELVSHTSVPTTTSRRPSRRAVDRRSLVKLEDGSVEGMKVVSTGRGRLKGYVLEYPNDEHNVSSRRIRMAACTDTLSYSLIMIVLSHRATAFWKRLF